MKYLIIFLFLLIPININALEINSEHAILYNMNEDMVLYEKDADTRTYIASLTKIMTTIVAIENIDDINETVTIPYEGLEGLWNASVAGFKLGQKATYKDLLYGILLPSGADAAKTIAYYIAGSEEKYVDLMNQKAKDLGLTNTHFANTTGLDIDNHYSTVREISIILKYALQNEIFKEIYTTNTYTTSDNSLTFKSVFSNYLTRYGITNKYIYGSKTGYTTLAGYCLSTIAHYNGVEYMLITTNADGTSNYPLHVMDANMIYDYYINNYHYLNIVNKNDTLITLDTKNSKEDKLEIKSNETISKYLKNNITKEDFVFDYKGLDTIDYFTKKGQIGTLDIKRNNEVLETIPIMYNGELSFSFISLYLDNLIISLPITFILLILLLKLRPKKS